MEPSKKPPHAAHVATRIWNRATTAIGIAVARCLPQRLLKWIAASALSSLSFRSSDFATFWNRPKRAGEIAVERFPLNRDSHRRVAIVVQGPIFAEDDFTVETLKWYRKAFPDSPLILSTWEGSDPAVLTEAGALGVHVVLSTVPQIKGPSNFNLQLLSTLQGILKARELDATHVLKTRADQRLYSRSAMTQLLALQQAFPLLNGGSQRERIVALSYTLRYVPYHLCDFLLFGHIDDLLAFWGTPPDARSAVTAPLPGRDVKDAAIPEILLCSSFLKATGWDLKWTVTDTWRAYRERFCLIDHEAIDIYWHKGERLVEYRNRFYQPSIREMMGFLDWLALWQFGVREHGDADRLMELPMNTTAPDCPRFQEILGTPPAHHQPS